MKPPANSESSGTHPPLPSSSHQHTQGGSLHSPLESLSARFKVVGKQIHVGNELFSILKVRDTNELLDTIEPHDFSIDERLPYWADIWTSAIELARYSLEEAGLNGKDVLELGCGLGLAGIAAAKGGGNVVLSDYEDDALDFARYNAQKNLSPEIVNSRTRFINLDWRHIDKSLPPAKKFDMIIAADVVYERRNFFPLMDVLQQRLKPTGVAVFTEPGRSIGDHFLNLLREAEFGLTVTECKVELDGKASDVRRIVIQPGNTA